MTELSMLDLAKTEIYPDSYKSVEITKHPMVDNYLSVRIESNSGGYSEWFTVSTKQWNIAIQNALISIGKVE